MYVNGKPYNVRSTDDMANHLMMTEVKNIIIINDMGSHTMKI